MARRSGSKFEIIDAKTEAVISVHRGVDVAFKLSKELEKKGREVKLEAVSPFGRATVYDDERWKWGSKTQIKTSAGYILNND